MENIKELLRKAEETADLRKKETLRLIGASKKVLREIAKLKLPGEVKLEGYGYDDEGTVFRSFLRSTGEGEIEIRQYLERLDGSRKRISTATIAYDSVRHTSDRIPGKNEYGIPEDYHLTLHIPYETFSCPENENENVLVNFYPPDEYGRAGSAMEVPAKWFCNLPFHEKKPDTIPRSLWILVAHHLVELAQDIVSREEKKLSDTSEARELAEKLANAVS